MGSIGSTVSKLVSTIVGATDFTAIGNVGDRLKVTGVISSLPTPVASSIITNTLVTQTVNNSTVTLITETVPALKTWRIHSVNGACRSSGKLATYLDGNLVSLLLTDAAQSNVEKQFKDYVFADTGSVITMEFTQSFGPPVDIAAFLEITEYPA